MSPGWRPVGLVGCLLSVIIPAAVGAQSVAPLAARSVVSISMDDAVQLALLHNQQINAQRLSTDMSKADETTAAVKPNPVFSVLAEEIPIFSPSALTLDYLKNNQSLILGLNYTFERGSKRDNRLLAAEDTTDVTAKGVLDAERRLRLDTRQTFISVLLAKSTLDLTVADLKSFSNVVEISQQRVQSGDLSEGDYLKIKLQLLQFQRDVSVSELALVQARAVLRQLIGYQSVPEDFEVAGELAYRPLTVSLEDLQREALAARPDLLASQSGIRLAEHIHLLELSNRSRDVTGGFEYDRAGSLNAIGFGLSFELPFNDKNQGNIARAKVAIQQASIATEANRVAVLTEVLSAYTTLQTSQKIVSLYESGYLEQAQESLDISRYVYQRGAGSLLDLLDAERTFRSIQLGYRQALSDYMNSEQQLSFAIGKEVRP